MAPGPRAANAAPPKQPFRFSAIKQLANFSPTAAFRKGRVPGDEDAALTPDAEAHLCQLAALENFADHGMFVKFSDEEAATLESKALDWALSESKEEEEARKSGKPLPKHLELVQNSQALSRTQAEKLLDRLKSSDDPLFEHVASSLAAGREPVSTEPAPGTLHAAPASAMPPPPPKFSTFSAFKKKLMPKFGKPKKTDDSFPAVPPPTTQLPPGALGHGYSPGSYDHFAAEAAGRGMEYSNGYIFPKDYILADSTANGVEQMENERLASALALSAARDQSSSDDALAEADGAVLAVALEESKTQTEFEQVLREARLLRRDLQHEQSRCRNKQRGFEAQKAGAESKRVCISGGQGGAPHLARQCAEADHNARDAESRAEALGEAVEELGHLEAYIEAVQPPMKEAEALTDAIVRELLERLNLQGFDFHVPASKEAVGSGIDDVIAKYRKVSPAPLSPAATSPARSVQSVAIQATPVSTPQKASPQKSLETLAAPEDSRPMTITPSAFQSLSKSATRQEPAAAVSSPLAPVTPVKPAVASPRWLSNEQLSSSHALQSKPAEGPEKPERKPFVSGASQRVQKMASVRRGVPKSQSNSSTLRASASQESLGMERKNSLLSVSSRKSWDEKHWSLPTGPVTVKRTSQVVHVYNELRRSMPSLMQTAHASAGPMEGAVLPKPKKGLLTDLVLDSKLQDEAREAAEEHARLLTRLASVLKRARLKDVEAAVNLREDLEKELAAIGPDSEKCQAVLAQFPSWPTAKWDSLKEATAVLVDLEDMANGMRRWTLGEGSYQQEVKGMEVFFDAIRTRVEVLQGKVRSSEQRWAAAGVPWDSSAIHSCRAAALHLATLFMSRALFEVANLARSQTLKTEACIEELATAVRVAYKVHQFVGGFHADAIALFDKVKGLVQSYVRSRDPTWLRDSSKLTL